MATFESVAAQTTAVNRVSENVAQKVRMFRDGTLATADFFQALVIEGRVFTAVIGSVSTPITWTATAAIDITKPAAFVVVPSGTTIFPLSIQFYAEAFGTNAQFECNAVLGTGGSYTSGGTAVTPANNRSDRPRASTCTVYAGDNSMVAVGSTTNLNQFWRDGQQFAITKTTASATAAASDPCKFPWKWTDVGFAPEGQGACQLAVHQGSQAGTGFIVITYAELLTSEMN